MFRCELILRDGAPRLLILETFARNVIRDSLFMETDLIRG